MDESLRHLLDTELQAERIAQAAEREREAVIDTALAGSRSGLAPAARSAGLTDTGPSMPATDVNAYLATRVSILRDRLLPETAFAAMVGQSLEQILAARVGDLDLDAEADPALLDRAMKRAILADVAVILRPLQGAARGFFLYWARRFELFNLKAMIRGKLRGLPDAEMMD